MNITIHRGTHEIGGSCVEIGNEDSRIVIDIGMPLLNEDGSRFNSREYKHFTDPELVREKILPDIKGCYDWDTEHKPIDGILLSHAHIDHFGFLNYLNKNIDCYLGEGTKHLIDISNQFTNLNTNINRPVFFKNGTPFQAGSFKITPFLMDHSIFDAYAFLVESDGKRILYSGDFREHGGNPEIFEQFLRNAPKDVDALLLEGTLIGSPSRVHKTEEDVEHEIEDILKNTDGIAFMVLSTQNIDRFMSFFNAAQKTNRLLVIDVYTANILDSIKKLGSIPHLSKEYPNLRVYFFSKQCRKLTREGKETLMFKFRHSIIRKDEVLQDPGRILMMARSSIVHDLKIRFDMLLDGATIIYSMWRGYLEGQSMKELMDLIERYNMKLIPVHATGHAHIKTLKRVVDTIQPKTIIPIHTFSPERYKDLFPNVLQVSDGETIRI